MNDTISYNELGAKTPADKIERLLVWSFGGVFFLFVFLYGIRPIDDPDFWWHLKSGEVMIQTGGLLQSDPFTFTGDGVVSDREALILKGYWLWQVTTYGFYSLFGFNGIFLLNLLTIGAMIGVVVQQLRRQQIGNLLIILLLTLGFTLLRNTFPLERPQVVSFLFAAILLVIIARVRDGESLDWKLPLLMMVWANLHGGFVVGIIILFFFSLGAVVEYRHDLPRLRHLLLWVVAGAGASLLNPNGALVFTELFNFHNSALMTGTSEYQSSWAQFKDGSRFVVNLWVLIALYGVGILTSRRLYWPEFFVALFLACFSVAYMRNVGFFAVAMLPAIGYSLRQGGMFNTRTMLPVFRYFFVFMALIALLWQTKEHWQGGNKNGPVSTVFPEKSTQFILDSGLQGRMLNNYNFGGYLLWKLYPQSLVFIDGRGLDANVYSDWKAMISASLQEVGGRKEFEVLLDRYDIDYVVQSLIHPDTGRIIPLLKFLLISPDWTPVYVDQQSVVMVRNSQKNSDVIALYRMEKLAFINKMIDYLSLRSNKWPEKVTYHVGLADLLIFVDRNVEAEKHLAMISRLQPDNRLLPWLRNQLNSIQSEKK